LPIEASGTRHADVGLVPRLASQPPRHTLEEDKLALLDTLLTRDTAMVLLRRATRFEADGNLSAARAAYRKIAALDELAAVALTHCARIERELGSLQESVHSLTAALHHCVSDRDRSHELYVELGDVQAQLGDYVEASYYYRRALCYEPRRVEVQRRLRSALRLQNLC